MTRKGFRIIKFYLLAFVFYACSHQFTVNTSPNKRSIEGKIIEDSTVSKLVRPYKDSMDKVMNAVIGYTDEDMISKRPSSNLMNWAADAILSHQTRDKRLSEPVMVLLNTGGLRSSFGKGAITLGDVYKLMPFDNQIVWARFPKSALSEISNYLVKSGGEPIANAKLKDGKILLDSTPDEFTHFWVITSDYLLNGGDKMDFFKTRVETNETGILIRDVFIDAVKEQVNLQISKELRIELKN